MNILWKYPIYDISGALDSLTMETIGSKTKGWISYELNGKNFRVLFKKGRIGTGENWAEKITCELAELLDLPHASYELADFGENELCVISPKFLNETEEELRLGNELIEGFDKNQKFKNTKHTLQEILNALRANNVKLPWTTKEQEGKIIDARDLFIGYLCFDAWIANTDRHAENWGIITKLDIHNAKVNVLAPTFDHASSLGRNESDKARLKRLSSKDKGYNVQGYVQGAKMPIYNNNGDPLNPVSLAKECLHYIPNATIYWIKKISKIVAEEEKKIRMIFDRIPDKFISRPAIDFAITILQETTRQLSELIK